MKFLKGLLKWVLILFLIANSLIWLTGNNHVYRAVGTTFFKGRTGPSIDDHKYFTNAEVNTGAPQPWRVAASYNAVSLAEEDNDYHQKLGSAAYLVIKNDSIIHETYWDGYNKDSHTNSFSVAKSIVGVLVGCAIQDGLIKDINEPVVNYLPEYREVTGDKITIRHLLTMSSGINFDENYVNPFGMMAKAYYGKDMKELVKDYRPTGEPGKEFHYLGGNTLLLGFLVEKVTGSKLAEYATEKLWIPMGAENKALWTIDEETGTERSYCCFYSNARDFARLGKLYLDSGRWNGNQLLPQQYVLDASKPASDVMDGGQPLRIYGYQWWCMDYNGEKITYARGILGQYIIVRPEKNMVIVRLGKQRDLSKTDGHPGDVFRWIEMADGF